MIFCGNVSVHLGDEVIENVKHQKDLGIIISLDFKRTNHFSKKFAKAQSLYFFIRSTVPWSFAVQLKSIFTPALFSL